ncbi:hypothetical protein NKR23_g12319 [Pleurostoma richardsiae]|uniref:Uncharacterized protein n=1 Tax=Pleurostoma richardsiae TaxID=41990 RepID=A0AA38VCX0_9PEZI|nr:hypothetical protein NKR23_g12319 [Pleurostoma richardsiae]
MFPSMRQAALAAAMRRFYGAKGFGHKSCRSRSDGTDATISKFCNGDTSLRHYMSFPTLIRPCLPVSLVSPLPKIGFEQNPHWNFSRCLRCDLSRVQHASLAGEPTWSRSRESVLDGCACFSFEP